MSKFKDWIIPPCMLECCIEWQFTMLMMMLKNTTMCRVFITYHDSNFCSRLTQGLSYCGACLTLFACSCSAIGQNRQLATIPITLFSQGISYQHVLILNWHALANLVFLFLRIRNRPTSFEYWRIRHLFHTRALFPSRWSSSVVSISDPRINYWEPSQVSFRIETKFRKTYQKFRWSLWDKLNYIMNYWLNLLIYVWNQWNTKIWHCHIKRVRKKFSWDSD